MRGTVIVAGMEKLESEELCSALESENYRAIAKDSMMNLQKTIQETACLVLILDLDSSPVDNRFINQLRRVRPGLPIIGLSTSPYHPELKEALSSHICACLSKPPDLDELLYCIRSFALDALNSAQGYEEKGKPN